MSTTAAGQDFLSKIALQYTALYPGLSRSASRCAPNPSVQSAPRCGKCQQIFIVGTNCSIEIGKSDLAYTCAICGKRNVQVTGFRRGGKDGKDGKSAQKNRRKDHLVPLKPRADEDHGDVEMEEVGGDLEWCTIEPADGRLAVPIGDEVFDLIRDRIGVRIGEPFQRRSSI